MLENIGQFETSENKLFTYEAETLCDIMLDIASKPLFEANSLEVVYSVV